jgi:hypothetical protein
MAAASGCLAAISGKKSAIFTFPVMSKSAPVIEPQNHNRGSQRKKTQRRRGAETQSRPSTEMNAKTQRRKGAKKFSPKPIDATEDFRWNCRRS